MRFSAPPTPSPLYSSSSSFNYQHTIQPLPFIRLNRHPPSALCRLRLVTISPPPPCYIVASIAHERIGIRNMHVLSTEVVWDEFGPLVVRDGLYEIQVKDDVLCVVCDVFVVRRVSCVVCGVWCVMRAYSVLIHDRHVRWPPLPTSLVGDSRERPVKPSEGPMAVLIVR